MAMIETTETPEDIERLLEKARLELQAFEDAVDGERLLARVKRASPAHPVLLARAIFLGSGTLFLIAMIGVASLGLFHRPSALFLSGLQEKMGIPGGVPAVCIILALCMFVAYTMATLAAKSIGRETPMLQWEAKEYQKLVNEVTRLTTQKAVMERIRGTPGGARPRIATPVPMSMRGRGPTPSAGGFGGGDSAFGGGGGGGRPAAGGGGGFGGGFGNGPQESVPPYLQQSSGNAGFGADRSPSFGGMGASQGGGDQGGFGGGFGGGERSAPAPSSNQGGFGGGFGSSSAPSAPDDDGFGVGLPPTGGSLLSRARSGGSPAAPKPNFGGNGGNESSFGGQTTNAFGGGSSGPSFGGNDGGFGGGNDSGFGGGNDSGYGGNDSGYGGNSGSSSSFGGNSASSSGFGGGSGGGFGGSSGNSNSGFGGASNSGFGGGNTGGAGFGEQTPSYVEFAEEGPTERMGAAFADEEVSFNLEEAAASPTFGGTSGFGEASPFPTTGSGFGTDSHVAFDPEHAPLGDLTDNTAGVRIGSPTRGGTPLGARPRAGIALGSPRLAAPMGFPGTPEPSDVRMDEEELDEYDAEIMEDLSYSEPETAAPRVGIQMARVRQTSVPAIQDPSLDVGDIVETTAPGALVEAADDSTNRENGLPNWGRIDEMWLEEAIEKAEHMVRGFPEQARLLFSVEEHLPFTLVIERATPAMAVRAMVTYVEFLASIYTPHKGRIELRKVAHLDRSFHRNVDAALQPYFSGKVTVENNGGQVDIVFQDPDPGWDAYPTLPMV